MSQILVAEDSRFSRLVVTRGLRNAGYEVVEATNGRQALELFEQCSPECVVTDLLMPEMDGVELLAAIRGRGSDVPVIVASADIQKSSRSRCKELGISAFMEKPVDADELVECIRAALDKPVGVGK